MTDSSVEAGNAPVEPMLGRTLEALLEDARLGQVWMMEFDGHPAGFVVLTVGFSMASGGLRGFIEDFFVSPRYRRKGLAHTALEEVKRACRRRGVRSLVVENRPGNTAAFNAYRRVGFAESGASLLVLPLS